MQREESQEKEAAREAYEMSQMIPRYDQPGGLMSFNVEYGFLEAVLRGFRSGFLTEFEYGQLCLCESLEEVKLALGDTDYKNALQMLPSGATPEMIFDRCQAKTIAEFDWVRKNSVGVLSTFIEFITYEYLIQSVQFIITSLIKGSKPETLVAKCHPLGRSPHILKSIMMFDNFSESDDGLVELYRTVLVDTPVAPYFERYFNMEIKADQSPREIQRHYDEHDIDIITNMLQKMWLEDFYRYTQSLGGSTAEVMKELLEFEADRRAISITINSFGTSLNNDENRDSTRQDLFCTFGTLYPEAILKKFPRVNNMAALQTALTGYPKFGELWRRAQDAPSRYMTAPRSEEEKWSRFIQAFTDKLYEHEVHINVRAMEGMNHFGAFYAYVKLKQQEERNLKWILSCIYQKIDQKQRARWIKIFDSK